MSQLDSLFRQMGVKSSKNDTQEQVFIFRHSILVFYNHGHHTIQRYSHQQYVKLDSSEPFVANTSTAIADLEASLFAKYSEVVDDNTVQPVKAAKRATSKIGDNGDENSGSDSESEDDDDDDEIIHGNSRKCQPCSAASKPKRYKSTDNDLKVFAYDMTRMGMLSCNPSVCKLGGNCVQNSTIADMRNMVNDFWGNFEDPAPSSKTRQLLILSILRSAYRPDSQEFHFYAGNKTSNNRRVCEAGYLILLGISNNPNASAAPRQWVHIKKYVKSGQEAAGIQYSTQNEHKLLKAEAKCTKFKSAKTFIEFFAKEFGDTIPGPEGTCFFDNICYDLFLPVLYNIIIAFI